MLSRARIVVIGTALIFNTSAFAQADYPTKPVRFIVPAAPGPFDAIARLLGDRLQRALGQPFVIDNMLGATSTIGMAPLAHWHPMAIRSRSR